MLLIRKAANKELDIVKSMLNQLDMAVADIDKLIENFMVIELDDKIVGTAGLDIQSPAALIKAVAVLPEYQDQMFDDGLIRSLINFAERRFVRFVFACNPSNEDLYKSIGFKPVASEEMLEYLKPFFDEDKLPDNIFVIDVKEFFEDGACHCGGHN